MEHLIPFPNFRAADDRHKIKQMEDYLYQLRETLELALTDIGPANFSTAFRLELQNLGMEMQNVQTNTEESQQRVEKVSGSQISVLDVLNSDAYKASIKAVKDEAEQSVDELRGDMESAVNSAKSEAEEANTDLLNTVNDSIKETKEIASSDNQALHETITEEIAAAKKEVLVITTGSDITFPDGTRMEFGSVSVTPPGEGEDSTDTEVIFQREYTEKPVVFISPGMTSDVTNSGFSVTATSDFTWIAIGKYN